MLSLLSTFSGVYYLPVYTCEWPCVAACVTVWLHWENSGRVTKNLLLDGVNLARKPVADCLVDDAEDDSVQGATGEHQLMKALTYLYYTCVDVNLHHTAAVWTTSPAAAASVPGSN